MSGALEFTFQFANHDSGSTDTPYLAHISNDQRVKVWNTATNALYAQLTEPQHLAVNYTSLAFIAGHAHAEAAAVKASLERASGIAATSGLIAAGTRKGGITVWSLQTKECQKLGGQAGVGHTGSVTGLAFKADGSRLFSVGGDGNVFEWDLVSNRPLRQWQASKQRITAVALSPNEKYLLTADTVATLWDIESAQPVATFTSHVDPINILRWTPDSTAFASGAMNDRFVHVWQLPLHLVNGTASTKFTRVAAVSSPAYSISLDANPAALSFSQPLAKVVSGGAESDSKQSKGKKKNAASSSKDGANNITKLFHIGAVSTSGIATIWSIELSTAKAAVAESAVESVALAEPEVSLVVKNLSVTNKVVPLVAGSQGASKLGKNKAQASVTRTALGITTEGAVCGISLTGVTPTTAATSGCNAIIVRNSHIHPRLQSVNYAHMPSGLDMNTSKPEFIESTIELPPMSELIGESTRLLSTDVMAADASVVASESLVGKRKELLGNVSAPGGSSAKAVATGTAPAKVSTKLDDAAMVPATTAAAAASGSLPVTEQLHTKRLRLLALTSDYTRALAERVNAADKYVRATKHSKSALAAVSKAGSLEVAMAQALNARDDKLFEQCISVGTKGGKKSSAIRTTIARLSPQHIVGLLSKCISKLQANPNRGPLLMPWIRECLYTHTGFLLTVPSLTEPLAALHRIVEQRLMSFKRLLGLQGRLDLIMSQVNRTSQVPSAAGNPTAKVVYDEAEDEETKDDYDGDDQDLDDDFDDDEHGYGDDDEIADRWGKLGYETESDDDDDKDDESDSGDEAY